MCGCVTKMILYYMKRAEVQNLTKNQKFPPPRKIFPKISPSYFLKKTHCLSFNWKKYCWRRRTCRKDLLDKAMVHSNVTSLLHLRIRDPELHCHECVGSGLRQHSRRQLRFWSQERHSAEISEFLVHHVRKKLKQSLSFLFLSSATI